MTAYSCGTVGDSHTVPLPNALAKVRRKNELAKKTSIYFSGDVNSAFYNNLTITSHSDKKSKKRELLMKSKIFFVLLQFII